MDESGGDRVRQKRSSGVSCKGKSKNGKVGLSFGYGASSPAPSVRNGGLGVKREEAIKSAIQQWNDRSTNFSGWTR